MCVCSLENSGCFLVCGLHTQRWCAFLHVTLGGLSGRPLRRFKRLARYSPSTWLQKQSACACSCSQPAVSAGRIHSLHTCSKQQGCRLTHRPADWWARWREKTWIERERVRKQRRESTLGILHAGFLHSFCLFSCFLKKNYINQFNNKECTCSPVMHPRCLHVSIKQHSIH